MSLYAILYRIMAGANRVFRLGRTWHWPVGLLGAVCIGLFVTPWFAVLLLVLAYYAAGDNRRGGR